MMTAQETADRNANRAAALKATLAYVVRIASESDAMTSRDASGGVSLRAASDSWSLVIDAVRALPDAYLSADLIRAATGAHVSCRYDSASDAAETSRAALARIRSALA